MIDIHKLERRTLLYLAVLLLLLLSMLYTFIMQDMLTMRGYSKTHTFFYVNDGRFILYASKVEKDILGIELTKKEGNNEIK